MCRSLTEKKMPNVRSRFSARSKYYISKHAFLVVLHYCMMYQEWLAEYKSSAGLRGVQSGSGSSGISDPTASQAIRLHELEEKIDLIERTAFDAEPGIASYLLRGVTTEGMTFDKLKGQGLPCERKMYYDRRRKFYWLMSQRLNIV